MTDGEREVDVTVHYEFSPLDQCHLTVTLCHHRGIFSHARLHPLLKSKITM